MRKHAKNTFTKLAQSAKFLKKLYIDHYDVCQRSRDYYKLPKSDEVAKRVAKDCKEMLQLLEKSYEEGGVTFNALDIVDYYLQPCCGCPGTARAHNRQMLVATQRELGSCQCACGEAGQQHERMRQELRKWMGKVLEIKVEEGKDARDQS